MRRQILSFLFVFSSLALAFAGPAGKYTGTWTGAQADGAFTVALSEASKGEWTADVSFTYQGQDVKCKTVSTKVDGDKVELVYEFDLGGVQGRSTANGEVHGEKFEGSYTTKAPDGSSIDQGTFKVAAQK